MLDRVKIIGGKEVAPNDTNGLNKLQELSTLPHVRTPSIALPDFHWKQSMEAPSSIAISVKGHIIPHLTSTSMNCGMGAIVTNLHTNDIQDEGFGRFYDSFRSAKEDPRYEVSKEVLYQMLRLGPKGLQEKYKIEDEIVSSFEFKGNTFGDDVADLEDVSRVIPADIVDHELYSGRSNLGTGFGGNHFLEIQKVSSIIDEKTAHSKNIKEVGQIIIMYHGGGGIIPGLIGAYFSKRNLGYTNDIKTNLRRYLYHLQRSGLKNAFSLFRYYLYSPPYVAFPSQGCEGKRLAFANQCSMNYGYAYRMFMLLRTRDCLAELFGQDGGRCTLYSDVAHNSILPDEVALGEVWVHRHNSCRVTDGDLMVLPGFNNTSSYLCIGDHGSSVSDHTVPHGAGALIKQYIESGRLSVNKENKTLIYRNQNTVPEIKEHVTDEAIDALIDDLRQQGIMRPVAKLTPMAVLKDFR